MPDLLADAFAELPAEAHLCPLGVILAQASPAGRDRLTAALKAEHVSLTWIGDRIRVAGHKIGKDTLFKHRAGRCRCPHD